MDPRSVKELLEGVRDGRVSPDEAASRLATLPYEDLGFAKVDHHRALRRGFPEAVFGAGKTPEQVVAIVERMAARGQRVLVTRTTAAVQEKVAAVLPDAQWHDAARCITVECGTTTPLPGPHRRARRRHVRPARSPRKRRSPPQFHGASVERIYDVGVAGLHRLLDRADAIREADVVIVVAGMEGALPSVVAGLVDSPVDRGPDERRLRRLASAASPRCSRCSTPAPRASRS